MIYADGINIWFLFHPAIIAPDDFDAVQAEIERRKKLGRPCGCGSPFTAKIICGDCGGFYGSKVWGSNTKYRRTIWQCNDKYKGDAKCITRHVTEDEVKKAFLIAFSKLLGNREDLIADCRLAQNALCDCSAIDAELADLQQEIEVVVELSRKAIYENARIAQSQEEWSKRNNGYLERHRRATERIAELEEMKREQQAKGLQLEAFIRELASCPLVIDEFDERLWVAAVDTVTVTKDGRLVFRFKDGTER